MPDELADRFLDKLMDERREAENKAAELEGGQVSEAVEKVEERLPETTRPVPKSAIMKVIDEKGEVSPEDLMQLVAREVRRGV